MKDHGTHSSWLLDLFKAATSMFATSITGACLVLAPKGGEDSSLVTGRSGVLGSS